MAQPIERRVLYAGSFDPPTNGHKWVMGEVSSQWDKGFVAIGINSGKDKGRFPISEREKMLEEIIVKEFPNLIVTSFVGMYAADFAETLGAKTVVRGLRDGADFINESNMGQINSGINPEVRTIAMFPPLPLLQISSSSVMGLMGYEGWENTVTRMVPENVFKRLEALQTEKDKKMLGDKWLVLCTKLKVKENQHEVFDELFKRYSETHRKYHNVNHLKTSLNELELVRDQADDPDALEMGIWFHDAVHLPVNLKSANKPDDEGESAQLAIDRLTKKLGLSKDFAEKVASLIIVTKHDLIPQKYDGKLIADIDLAIFGRSSRLYNIYEENIRQEYSSVPDDIFIPNRGKLLESFITPSRKSIYQTYYFNNRYEQQAHANLEKAYKRHLITQLTSKSH